MVSYPPRRASAARMREELRDYLAGQAVDAVVAGEVVLATDEAFVNAVTHAHDDGMIHVSAYVSGREASIEVQDHGGGFTPRTPRRAAVPDALLPHGRGMFLMEHMMDAVSIESGGTGTTVRMVRRLD